MPTQYRVLYYSGKGRGEPIRMMFALAGVKFEDIRFEHDEWLEKYKKGWYKTFRLGTKYVQPQWKRFKFTIFFLSISDAPYGQCPYVEIINGDKKEVLCHSMAIVRYLARSWGEFKILYINDNTKTNMTELHK